MTHTGTTPGTTHEDPAVQALIDDQWLIAFDGVTVDDLVSAARVVRATDREHAQLVRTEYAACTVRAGNDRLRNETGTNRAKAEERVRAATAAAMTLGRETLEALGVVGHVIEQRKVWQLPDGYELVGPWHEPGTGADR